MTSNKVRLGDIAEIVMGQSPKGDTCNNDGHGKPLLNGPTEFGTTHPHPTQFTTDAKKTSQVGDILFCVRGSTTGRMNYGEQEYAIGRGIGAIRGKGGYSTPFVKSVIESNLAGLLKVATGTTFPNLGKDALNDFEVEIVDSNAAKFVGKFAEQLEDKIANNITMNQTLEKIAQRIFKSWFIDFDPVKANKEGLPFDGLSPEIQALFPSEFEDSELGMIPKGWEVGKISTVSKVSSGKRPTKKVDAQDSLNNIPVWGGNGIKWFTNSTLTDKPFIITGRVGTLGTVYKVFDKVWVSDNALMLFPESAFFDYLFHALREFDLHSLNSGSTQPLITQTAVKNIPLILPNEDILIKFQSIMDSLNEKRKHNEKSSECLRKLRDRLLPKLISGQISVGEAKQELAEAI
ncbi:restriction endonuclease subunit S [Vibrio parahaemolyticus]|nr:restriction endonuclease subunit S [Vibrio parahaemolyticus]